MGLADGFYSITQRINKVLDANKAERTEGTLAPVVDELELSMSDEDLIDLKKQWVKQWENERPKLEVRQDRVRKYWLGKGYENLTDQAADVPLADNAVFEAFETYVPMVTRQRPEPQVSSDGSPDGDRYANCWKKVLAGNADRVGFKLILKQFVRNWGLSFLGSLKIGWDAREDDVHVSSIRVQKLVLDPNGTVINGENVGEAVGEIRRDKASVLIGRFPKSKDVILEAAEGKEGTYLQYHQWSTNDYVFFTLKDKVFGKAKNPNWDYGNQTKDVTDEFGNVNPMPINPVNVMPYPVKPYVFLSPFNEGLLPYDSTNLIEQVMGLQRIVTKRGKQIDRNADRTNGAVITTGKAFDKEQASKVCRAIEEGGNIHIPDATLSAGDAAAHLAAPALPSFVYENAVDSRTRIMDIFGTRGTSAGQSSKEKTVGGKVILRQQDTDRIGGGVTEFLEQCVERAYTLMAQICAVYYDEAHFQRYLSDDETKFIMAELANGRRFSVSIKEGSMLPKDSLSKRQEAIDLFQISALDPLTLYERLEFADPKEAVQRLITWQTNPAGLIQQTGQQPIPAVPVQPANSAQPMPPIAMPNQPMT